MSAPRAGSNTPLTIAVVGLGKLGLPLAVAFAGASRDAVEQVIGLDTNHDLVTQVNAGIEPWPGEHDLERRLRAALAEGRLTGATEASLAIPNADAVIVVVPLTVNNDRSPDFGPLDSATTAIAPYLRPGTLVSYETTMPVGTTRQRLAPRLAEGSGLTLGTDLFVVHSPERVLTGRVFEDLQRYPKIVGGIDPASAERGAALYQSMISFRERDDLPKPNGVWRVRDADTAEAVKLAETTYRNVNIGLANQFARWADHRGVDIHQVIAAANSQPYSHIHQPGVSVGGHCIPVYPHLYMLGDPSAAIPTAAVAINDSMPSHVADLTARHADGGIEGKQVAILGLSYRPGVAEAAFSGTPILAAELERKGATVVVSDPLFTDEEIRSAGLTPLGEHAEIDVLVVHTAHPEWLSLGPADFPTVRLVVDGRHHLAAEDWAGVTLITLGNAGPDPRTTPV